ncbi:MAG: hypothetical protein K2Y39_17425 [Candidatus Obscuribacterales bacterium]|nr:hypothetical protein [Candidatus Obscuribacterales bacterium]
MTVDTIGAATRTFAATVDGVLLRLETRLREHGAASGLPVIRTSEIGSGVDRAQQAKVDAASAIFAAERNFSAACLREISASGAGSAASRARDAKSAGDAILLFAATRYRGIVGRPIISSDSNVWRLLDIADRASGGGSGRGTDREARFRKYWNLK